MIARQQAIANRKGPPEVEFGLHVSIPVTKGRGQIVQYLSYFEMLSAVGLFVDLESFPEPTVCLRVAAQLQCYGSEVVQNGANQRITLTPQRLVDCSCSLQGGAGIVPL